MTKRAAACQRDRPETSLSRLLEGLWSAHPEVISAVLVDGEGECIDYCTGEDLYEAKVMAATWLDATMHLRRACHAMGASELRQWLLETDKGAVTVRRVSDDYSVVVQLSASLNARLLVALDALVVALRADVGDERRAWDPERDPWLGRRLRS